MHRPVWHRLVWLAIPISLAACGGGKSAGTLTVTCDGGTQLYGAVSVDVLGDVADGRPILNFPDPTNAGRVGSIAVPARGRCKIVPQPSS
jgi:hypothetical protein